MYKHLKEVISARMVFWLLTRMSMHIYLLQDLSSMAVPLGTVWFCLNMGYPKNFMVRTCVFPLKPLWYLPFSDNIIEDNRRNMLNIVEPWFSLGLLVFHSGQTFENATPKKSFWKWLRLRYFEWTATVLTRLITAITSRRIRSRELSHGQWFVHQLLIVINKRVLSYIDIYIYI